MKRLLELILVINLFIFNLDQLYSLKQKNRGKLEGVNFEKAMTSLSEYVLQIYKELNNHTVLFILSDPSKYNPINNYS